MRMCAMAPGRAGGKVNTGAQIKADGTTVGRTDYAALRIMGLDAWCARSNNTSKESGEILP